MEIYSPSMETGTIYGGIKQANSRSFFFNIYIYSGHKYIVYTNNTNLRADF